MKLGTFNTLGELLHLNQQSSSCRRKVMENALLEEDVQLCSSVHCVEFNKRGMMKVIHSLKTLSFQANFFGKSV